MGGGGGGVDGQLDWQKKTGIYFLGDVDGQLDWQKKNRELFFMWPKTFYAWWGLCQMSL